MPRRVIPLRKMTLPTTAIQHERATGNFVNMAAEGKFAKETSNLL